MKTKGEVLGTNECSGNRVSEEESVEEFWTTLQKDWKTNAFVHKCTSHNVFP
jgi:hypothetical protein